MIILAGNAVTARVYADAQRAPAPPELRASLSELLSYPVADQTTGKWVGTSTFYSWERDTFPAGFLALAAQHMKQRGVPFQLVRKAAPPPLGLERPVVDEFGYDDMRYAYQPETVERLLRHRQTVAQIATGGGKSRVCTLAIARIKRPALFLTTRRQLMYQMRDQLALSLKLRTANGEPELAGYAIGVVGDGEIAPRKFINVAMVQTLRARLWDDDPEVRRRTREFLARFELVIAEEAHEAGGEGYYDVMTACVNASYRLALTGTPFMKENQESNMRLMACSGAIGITVSEKQLIDNGVLATPYFKYIRSDMPPNIAAQTKWPTCYNRGVVENRTRNDHILFEARRFRDNKLPTLVLVLRKKHGAELQQQLCDLGVRAQFIWGESDQATRDRALRDLAECKLDVLIGSNILDVGVDVPSVGGLILAGGMKEEVGLRQRIGRALRAKKGRGNVTYIVDFDDTRNRILKRQSNQRRAIVESTPGFADNILSVGVDFDFELARAV